VKHVQPGLVTYTLKPNAEVADAIETALSKRTEGKKGV
jgi:hypothetical protein